MRRELKQLTPRPTLAQAVDRAATPQSTTSRSQLSPPALLGLQQSYGNRAVTGLIDTRLINRREAIRPATSFVEDVAPDATGAGGMSRRVDIPPALQLGAPAAAPGAPGAALPDGMPARYAGLVRPVLSDADILLLKQATGGAPLIDLIARRNSAARRKAEIETAMNRGRGDMNEGEAFENYDRLDAVERDLTPAIDAQLAELGVAGEAALLTLVNERFPARFLTEAHHVADELLLSNKEEAESELARYSAQMCTPDIDGLLAADRDLAMLDPRGLQLSIQLAEEALSRYKPIAGPVDLDAIAAAIPASQASVIVAIANLEEYRAKLAQKLPLYNATRRTYGQKFPILLSNAYRPGSFSSAEPEALATIVAEPVQDILDNIDRVREAIADDEMKVWNMRDVMLLTWTRLGIDNPVLESAVQARIAGIEADEKFMGWVKAALSISTTLIAGILFFPAGVAVGALWGAESLYSNIDQYLNETAAENVALDATVADISMNEPTLTWVILDAMFLALDLGAAARALRPAARTLSQAPDALSLQAFRNEAAAQYGDEVAERLAERAAHRHGISTAGREAAEDTLAASRTILDGLGLSDDAIVRILAKGANVSNVKGQLFEEVMNLEILRRLHGGGDEVVGSLLGPGLEFIPGDRIRDLARQPLTDGMLVQRMPNGSMKVLVVFEAKSGHSVVPDLARISDGLGDPEEFAQFMIEQNKPGVMQVLQEAGLTDDIANVARGSEKLSPAAIEAVAAEKSLRKLVTQAELGGQVRKDAERLAPNTTFSRYDPAAPDDLLGAADEAPLSILVDNAPVRVHSGMQSTRYVGVVPRDAAKMGEIAGSLEQAGYRFQSMVLSESAAQITARAERLVAARPAPVATP